MRLVNDNFKLVYESNKPVILFVSRKEKQCVFCDNMKSYLKRIERKYSWIDFFELRDDLENDEHPIIAKLNIAYFPTIFFIDKSQGKNVPEWRLFKLEGEITEDMFLDKIKRCFCDYLKGSEV